MTVSGRIGASERLVAVDQPDVDAVGLAPLHELAEGRQLLLGVHIQEAAVHAQAEAASSSSGSPSSSRRRCMTSSSSGPARRVCTQMYPRFRTRGAIGQLVGLEQRHRRTSTREVICGRAADDAAADDEDVRGTGHLTSGPRQADRHGQRAPDATSMPGAVVCESHTVPGPFCCRQTTMTRATGAKMRGLMRKQP